MKSGARLLFFVAVVVVLLSLVDGAQQVVIHANSAGPPQGSTWVHRLKPFWEGLFSAWPALVSLVLRGLPWVTFPLFGALVVHRIDQWMAGRAQGRQDDV